MQRKGIKRWESRLGKWLDLKVKRAAGARAPARGSFEFEARARCGCQLPVLSSKTKRSVKTTNVGRVILLLTVKTNQTRVRFSASRFDRDRWPPLRRPLRRFGRRLPPTSPTTKAGVRPTTQTAPAYPPCSTYYSPALVRGPPGRRRRWAGSSRSEVKPPCVWLTERRPAATRSRLLVEKLPKREGGRAPQETCCV